MKKWLCLVSMLIICLAICNVSFAATTLKDIKGTKYESAVENLIEVGLVNGYPEDNTYRPNVVVTRAQMAKMMVVALGEEGKVTSAATKKSTFTDIKNGHWAYGYVNVAKDLGIINGYPNGNFGPDETVTYAEATTMVIRALGYDDEVSKSTENWPNNYTSYAKKLNLYDDLGTFTADNGAARGDVAIILWNMLRTGVCTVVGQTGDILKYGQGQKMINKYKNYVYLKDATITSVKFDDDYKNATVKIADDYDSVSITLTADEVLKYYGRKLEVMYKTTTKKLYSITDQKAYKVKSGSITDVTSKKIEIDDDDEYTLPSKSNILLYKVDSISDAIDATIILDGSTVKYIIASGAKEIKVGLVDEKDVKISKGVYGMKVKVAGSSKTTTYSLIDEDDMPEEDSVIIYYVNSNDEVGIVKELTDENASSIADLTTKKIKIGKTTYTYDSDTFTVLNVGTSSIKTLSFTKIDEDNDLVYVYENAGQTYLIVFEDAVSNTTETSTAKKNLETYIKNVDGKKESSYSQATYMEYYNALETAKTLVKSSSTTTKKLQQALEDLKTAVSGLKTVTSSSTDGKIAKARYELRTLVNGKAATVVTDKAKYTSASYTTFEKKLKVANTLLSESDTTEKEVTNAYNDLSDAITGMVLEAETQDHKDAVKLLEDALSKAEGKTESDYTAASWKTFKTARDKANTIKANTSSYTATNIKNAADTLTTAIDNLESAIDTQLNKLNALIADCAREVEDSEYYLESTYSDYEKAYDAALQIDSGDTVEDIKKATQNLSTAKAALITVEKVFGALKNKVGGNGKISDSVDSALEVEDKPDAKMGAIKTASVRMVDAMNDLINEAKNYVSRESGENFSELIKAIDDANDSAKEFSTIVKNKDYAVYIETSNNVLDNFVKYYTNLKKIIDDLKKIIDELS